MEGLKFIVFMRCVRILGEILFHQCPLGLVQVQIVTTSARRIQMKYLTTHNGLGLDCL